MSKTLYVWDGWRLVAELDARENNRVVAEYVPGPGYVDETVAVRRDLNRDGDFADANEGFLYPLADQQHSTVALLNASGTVVERYGYDAFGTPSFYDGAGNALAGGSAVGNTTLYTGRTWLPELGLYDYRQRLYDPAVGRFLTPDPAQDPANLGNPYTYTANNPHAFVDPYGEWGWDNDWVQTGLEIFGAGCLTGRGGAARSFWMDSGGEQLRGMVQGAGVVLGGDLGTAYEGMVAETAASYETRIALHSATNGGDVNAAIATATGWRMVGADLVGFTGLAEAGSGVDYTTGGILEGQERLQRGLVGGSQLAGTVAMVGSTGMSLARGYRGVGLPSFRPGGRPLTKPVGEIRAEGLRDAHHVIQDAAVRELPGYDPNLALGVHLSGPSTLKGTPHYSATQVQKGYGGGTYGYERTIGYRALRSAGFSRLQALRSIWEADSYFRGIGVTRETQTRIPGDRR